MATKKRSGVKGRSKPRYVSVWLFYGNATHRPMLTTSFIGRASELTKIRQEARKHGTPLRIKPMGK